MAHFDFEQFARGYSSFDDQTWHRLRVLYHPDARFRDPVHDIRGHEQIERYFDDMAQAAQDCAFTLNEPVIRDDTVVVEWQMIFTSKNLNKGRPITVDGISRLRTENGLIVEHRDYYDLGQMLYENVPLLGRIIRWLKGRLAGSTNGQESDGIDESVATEGLVRGK
ncbi:nuclear transport factor 2 family protein [Halioxenophilus aromaticivorans]|uniref:Nuclear transport factor 2 family protein n=1 Tax=Halioxenophilus aromaticivorans TaxID=1306992 RepID=A0AAV3TY51_9ALTE